jgi:hypothetical protein
LLKSLPARFALRRGSLRSPLRNPYWLAEPKRAAQRRAKAGGLAGTRTPDQCLKRALLYQLSYQPILLSRSLLLRNTNDFKHYVVTHCALCYVFLRENDEQKHSADDRATSLHKVAGNLYRLESSDGYYALLKRGGKQFHRSLKTKDRKLADRRLNDLWAKIGCLKISPDAKLNFEQAANLWLETNKYALSSNTVKRRKMYIKGLTLYLRNLPIRNITEQDCDRWVKERGANLQLQMLHRDGTAIDTPLEVKTRIFSAHTLMPLLFWLICGGEISMRRLVVADF